MSLELFMRQGYVVDFVSDSRDLRDHSVRSWERKAMDENDIQELNKSGWSVEDVEGKIVYHFSRFFPEGVAEIDEIIKLEDNTDKGV